MRTELAASGVALVLLMGTGCGSNSFTTATDAGSRDGSLQDTGGSEGTDASDAGACTSSAGAFCVQVAVASDAVNPGYDMQSGAAALDLDGKGPIHVFLFTMDPASPANAGRMPDYDIVYPGVGKQVDIGQDLPVDVSVPAAAGTYWLYVVFEDSTTTMRGAGIAQVAAGDFVTELSIDADAGAPVYPQVTLDGTAAPPLVTTQLKPVRLVNVTPSVASSLITEAAMNPSIHGTGPAAFVVVDRTSSGLAALDYAVVACVDLMLPSATPAPAPVAFSTLVVGSHSLVSFLWDYSLPMGGLGNTPGEVDTDTMNPTSLDVNQSSWTSSVTLPYVNVPMPVAIGTQDPSPSCP